MSFVRATCLFTLLVLLSSSAFAQATRTWVSGVGDDVNPCSRTAPCKTFAGAISKTAAKGEINTLDPGAYGVVTIVKSITIDGNGAMAGILATNGSNGIIVNAGPSDIVTLRNLQIDGAGTGLNGVRFIAGGELHLDNVTIFGFTGSGIDFEPGAASRLFVRSCVIRNVGGTLNPGVLISPGPSGSARASLNDVHLERNGVGLRAENRSTVSVRDSVASLNSANGFIAFSTAFPGAQISMDTCTSTNNGTNGAKSEGANSIVWIGNSVFTNNDNVGVLPASGGQIISFGNNRISGNTAGDGVISSTMIQR